MIRVQLSVRCLCAAMAAMLGGCVGMANWEAPPERMSAGDILRPAPEGGLSAGDPPRQAPDERPMLLTPESYRVTKGDTLFSIAFRNNLDYREIARWNDIGPDFRILQGQVLSLTPPEGDISVAAAAEPQTATAAATTPAPVVAPTVAPPAAPATATGSGSAPRPRSSGWQWPIAGSILRTYSPAQGVKGLDFTGTLGQPVFASAPGRVVYSGNALKGYGELIIIKHDDVHLSAYGYNRRRLVNEGDTVKAGQPIGELGMGPENKPLLHFEIRERGKPVNPASYLPARPAPG